MHGGAKQMSEESKKPEMKMRVSNIVLTLWNNDDIKSFQLEKIYTIQNDKKEDEWKSTKSFNVADVDKLIFLLEEFKRKYLKVDIQPPQK